MKINIIVTTVNKALQQVYVNNLLYHVASENTNLETISKGRVHELFYRLYMVRIGMAVPVIYADVYFSMKKPEPSVLDSGNI